MQNDYDFIMNNNPQKSGPSFLKSGKQRTFAMIAFVGGILVIVLILFSVLFSGGGKAAEAFIPIQARQEELIRMLEERDELSNSRLKTQYSTLYFALLSDNSRSQAYLSEFGVVVKPEVKAQYFYSDFDEDLESAKATNLFDQELQSYIDRAMSDYTDELVKITEPTEAQTEIINAATENILNYLEPAEDTESQE